MSALVVFLLIMFAVDLLIAIGIGTLFLCNKDYFWFRHDHKAGGKLISMLEISGTMFACFFLIFGTIHIWTWAPYSVAVPIFPFYYTWGSAMIFSLLFVVAWMFPIRRAFKKIEESRT